MLKIFNTLTRKKERLIPLVNGKIKIYVCGVTVYDLCHLGHARTFLAFDTIIRYLRHCGYQVNYVRNITDIDDKIIKRAYENNETTKQLTNRMIQEMHSDFDTLNILRPNYEPKVTDHINIIIKLIHLLIKKKHAYVASNGDIMFSVKTMHNYGILSRKKKIPEIYNNILKTPNIKNPLIDFVLWKTSKPGEPYWPSPWGAGRPGWHIECSAMNHSIFGNQLDIHGGGSDLIFPHHENEMAQSVCAYNIPYAKIWIHSGMLLLNHEKMSKSSNNFFTIRDILKRYDPETIRYFLMSAHYRNQLKYDDNSLKSARASLKRLYIALRDTKPNTDIKLSDKDYFISKFISKMNDDFNTPEAYSILFDIAHKLNDLKIKHHSLTPKIATTLKYLANIIGLLYQNPEIFLKKTASKNNKKFHIKKIKKLIKRREDARKNNQWELSDKIRNKLTVMGVTLEDGPTGITKWHYNNTNMQ
ncbi:cysteine--tRNA ligase [Blochmannia endosymbiont of Camponotus sp.]|uniref:cysteine--tRNA ligase n=1 Tax=Blochmannia endosymbiont of Camponotus sp. TaxID=700220 RepID=UPI0020246BDD|nr:cysteine--tRNA ligase [Blochmannia endosymbiont of Camponotus sp.]URJ30076.1 cysteine--tRNA ligase [Blochmannia endosymbiont of Camponotus sp.]